MEEAGMTDAPGTRRWIPAHRRQQVRRLVRRPVWGNLRRLAPISASFGFDRGTPIDRYYLRRFLLEEQEAIRGVTGEVSESRYVDEFGGDRVERVEVIDIDADNPKATIVTDLARAGSLPHETFDALVIVQTLQYTSPLDEALRTCLHALVPGGTLLLALPALTPHDPRIPEDRDYWRFLPAGVTALLHAAAPEARLHVQGYGNLVAALAFLHGVSAEELRPDELAHEDPRFPVLVCARVDVPGGDH
jgi:SAM-dependent methyltransferase